MPFFCSNRVPLFWNLEFTEELSFQVNTSTPSHWPSHIPMRCDVPSLRLRMSPRPSRGGKKTTYHSVGKVAELLSQHLLDHVWVRDDDNHPATKIVPGRSKKKWLWDGLYVSAPFSFPKRIPSGLGWRLREKWEVMAWGRWGKGCANTHEEQQSRDDLTPDFIPQTCVESHLVPVPGDSGVIRHCLYPQGTQTLIGKTDLSV